MFEYNWVCETLSCKYSYCFKIKTDGSPILFYIYLIHFLFYIFYVFLVVTLEPSFYIFEFVLKTYT